MALEEEVEQLAKHASNALRELLSEKHLYQSVSIDLTFLDEIAKHQHDAARMHAASPSWLISGGGPPPVQSLQHYRAKLEHCRHLSWFICLPDEVVPPMASRTMGQVEVPRVRLPTIKTVCSNRDCGELSPFNPASSFIRPINAAANQQAFYLTYQCQSCKGPEVQFLVRRADVKLTLCGRDPIETVTVPQVIPKAHAKHFRDAIVAHNSGQTLAGIFLMRVFVEQFWKSVPEVAAAVKGKLRPTGDELGDSYKTTLPDVFKERFPTLCEVYDSLSEAMHSARSDAIVFSKCREQIVEHFEARRLFKIVSPSTE